jgi:guanosine-3',5'-bis(diphosphate) 3'-pyrophosphohydrolase
MIDREGVPPEIEPLVQKVELYLPNPDLAGLVSAYECARDLHKGKLHASGEPLIKGLLAIALYCARLRLDQASIVSAILSSALDREATDEPLTAAKLADRFGEDVANLAQGVFALSSIEFESKEDRQAESFRMMLLALARDIRVVLVKLCERLFKLEIAHSFSPALQHRLALETRDIYAPLANRLGIDWLKSELQDFVLLYLRPEVYETIHASFGATQAEHQTFIAATTKKISSVLRDHGLEAKVTGRAKHYYSVWQKMEKSNLQFDEIHDLLGFRIIVPSVRECYEALGVIHALWKPVPGRFKDYIAMPKSNLYQSLHTTLVGPEGRRVEVQIRTPEMNQVAEEGIAAHWRYKERLEGTSGFDLSWVKELIETQAYLKRPDEFVQSVQGDLFPEQVIVFTPKGDIRRLPSGSTCLDFAYAIHTDVGHATIGAKVNGTMVALGHILENGDTVEVLTNKSQPPGKDWLSLVASPKAKQRLRAFFRSEERLASISRGTETLNRELKKHKYNLKRLAKEQKIENLLKVTGFHTQEDLLAALGYGKLSVTKLVEKIFPQEQPKEQPENPSALERIYNRAAQVSRERVGVRVDGIDNMVVRFARCCEPLPGDPIIGFISRGRGVTIHHGQCPWVEQFDRMRLVPVEWDAGVRSSRQVTLAVHSQDRIGLLVKMTEAITSNGADIRGARCTTSEGGKVLNTFDLAVNDSQHLNRLKRALEMVPGVTKVERISQSRQ